MMPTPSVGGGARDVVWFNRGLVQGACPARAALAGNPSDGYGGAVLALTLPPLQASARVLASASSDGTSELVRAAVARFARAHATAAARDHVEVRTTIPRSVGLGGSSAIVIAVLRALCAHHGVHLSPLALAELALAVETEELGIAAGPQDRVVQSLGGLVFMDFARGRHTRLQDVTLPPILVGWRAEAGGSSEEVHAPLRARFARGEPLVRGELERLAGCAREAAAALGRGDLQALRRAVDESFDARARMLELDPRHVELIARARGAGAAANFTGSGGAVVCVCADEEQRLAVERSLRQAGADTLAL
jgi:glucuronokinase